MEMIGQQDAFMQGYKEGRREALKEASNLEMEIRAWVHTEFTNWQKIETIFLGLEKYADEITKLMDKKNEHS